MAATATKTTADAHNARSLEDDIRERGRERGREEGKEKKGRKSY
jgi:hypothetical protein